MAQGVYFICNICAHSIESWDEGNPYYFESVVTNTGKVRQKKKYAYHPHHELLERCVGNDSPHLCLSCGKKFKVDSRKPITVCRKCKSADIVGTYELDGKPCPYCEGGVFGEPVPCGIS